MNGLQIKVMRYPLHFGRRMIANLRYADDIILLATSEAELQELVDRLDRVSHTSTRPR